MLRQMILGLSYGVVLSVASPGLALADVSPQMIELYNQAAQGDESKTNSAFESFSELIEQEGATGLSLIYLGASETLKGRDAFFPWNKMKYVEQGVAKIDKGLSLIENASESTKTVMGLPEYHLGLANAAAVFTNLPEMFNQFDKGYEIYVQLIDEEKLEDYPPQATSWIYKYAVDAANRAGDSERVNAWSEHLTTANNPLSK